VKGGKFSAYTNNENAARKSYRYREVTGTRFRGRRGWDFEAGKGVRVYFSDYRWGPGGRSNRGSDARTQLGGIQTLEQ